MKKLLYILVAIPACLVGITAYAIHCPQQLKYTITCVTNTGIKIKTSPIKVQTTYHRLAPECDVNDPRLIGVNGKMGELKGPLLADLCLADLKQPQTIKQATAIYGVDYVAGWHGGLYYVQCLKNNNGTWQRIWGEC